jgi:hypothetical protein
VLPIYSTAGQRHFVQVEVRADGPSIYVLLTDPPKLESNVPYRIDNQCLGTTVRFRQARRRSKPSSAGSLGGTRMRRKWATLKPFTSEAYAWDEVLECVSTLSLHDPSSC